MESGTKLDFLDIKKKANKKIHHKTQSDGSYKSQNFTISNKISGVIGKARLEKCCLVFTNPFIRNLYTKFSKCGKG